MDINTNPFELGLDRLVNLDADIDFIGKAALKKINDRGVTRRQVGLEISGQALSKPNTTFWPVSDNAQIVGKVTSAIHSPRLERNIALAMIKTEFADTGTQLEVQLPAGAVSATVVDKPFYDPNKKITTAG